MKIAFIVSMKYGLTQFTFRDIEALTKKGHHVSLFTLLNRPGLYNPLPAWNVYSARLLSIIFHNACLLLRRPILYLQLFATAIRTRSLANFAMASCFAARMQETDVIYAYFGDHKLFTGYYCKRIANIPLVVTVRAYELYCNPNPRMFIEALTLCDKILTITQHNRQQLIDNYAAPADKIQIVRQIVDLDAFKFQPKITILIVGFFAEKKGHEVLFRALQQLGREDLELWVVGDVNPSVRAVDCRKLASDLGIQAKVAFFGEQRDTALRALYRVCDIFCLPSRRDQRGDHEGFPNVIAEAMAFGKPVISTRHAGIPEAIDAILVDENNVGQLAAALAEACDSAELRQRLGVANRKRAEQMFSSKNTDRLEEVLLSVTGHAEPRARREDAPPPNLPQVERPQDVANICNR